MLGRAVMLVAGELVGLVERGENLFAHGFGLRGGFLGVLAQVFQHHHEFVAAQARHGVALAHAGGQALGDLLQQQVADVVAEGVVERLEVVQVDEQQCAISSAAGAGRQRLLQPVEQQPAVGQAGQRVVEGQRLDLVFRRLALGDVLPQILVQPIALRDEPVEVAHQLADLVFVHDGYGRERLRTLAHAPHRHRRIRERCQLPLQYLAQDQRDQQRNQQCPEIDLTPERRDGREGLLSLDAGDRDPARALHRRLTDSTSRPLELTVMPTPS